MLRTLAVAFIALCASASASVVNVNESETGWVQNGTPNNNGASPTNNYVAGIEGVGLRDWFEFAIPSFSGATLASATLNVTEPVDGHVGSAYTFAVYGLGAQPTTFAGITTANPFGSVGTSTADNGGTVSISLNAAALTALTADQGANLFIGGIDSAETSGQVTAGDFFGSGAANSSVLSLTFSTASVPEPSTLLLVVLTVTLLAAGRSYRRLRQIR